MRARRPCPGVFGRRVDPGTASDEPRLTAGVLALALLGGGGVLTFARLEDHKGRVDAALAEERAMEARVWVTLTCGGGAPAPAPAPGVSALLARVVRRVASGGGAGADNVEGPAGAVVVVVVVVLRVRVAAGGATGAVAAAAELLVVLEGRVDIVRGQRVDARKSDAERDAPTRETTERRVPPRPCSRVGSEQACRRASESDTNSHRSQRACGM